MLLFLTFISCREYLIKLIGQDMYVQGQETVNGLPTVAPRKEANVFTYKTADQKVSDKIVYVKLLPNQVFDIQDSATKLIFFPYHGRHNQQFQFVPVDMIRTYKIVQKEMCLAYIADEKIFRLEGCVGDNPYQLFEFICNDCPEKKGNLKGLVPIVEMDKKKNKNFLDDKTVNLIKEIGKLTSDINTCFINNGTCKSLDNSHIKLECYSPLEYPSIANEMWPDMKNNARHLEDYDDEPLAVISDMDGSLHKRSLKQSDEQEHLDSKHQKELENHVDPFDHWHTNEENYHGDNVSKNINPVSTSLDKIVPEMVDYNAVKQRNSQLEEIEKQKKMDNTVPPVVENKSDPVIENEESKSKYSKDLLDPPVDPTRKQTKYGYGGR
ncbi:hypothetical protein EDEG_02155 [Edhazardia aedis USNM 41457]|uniref:Uncharacterized protein n=1 Tax=Edhazardia aedis (strain USNM 41457) TaxID=1003232 RepID=J9D6V8_EDHAE|nr:hypothetical protein EDEG_02155 [Edhazardia aedis USNM 41457]|eukprot:EJW03511.1 hypothetical protein EDEG_02155 [Edhazardia aedis USNM 41457]